jgi:hypothetical protein
VSREDYTFGCISSSFPNPMLLPWGAFEMKVLCLLLAFAGMWSAAAAQTASRPQAAANPTGITGTAGVKTQLESLHYKNVRDLRRGPDGQWVGKAEQGHVPKTVTIAPDGTVTAR